MALQASYFKKVFHFNFNAKTSRGSMEEKVSWFIKLWDESNPHAFGVGECAPLPGLSLEAAIPEFETMLQKVVQDLGQLRNVVAVQHFSASVLRHFNATIPLNFPSVRFGVETAWLDLLQGGKRIVFKNDFLKGKPIPINGLIWMGDVDFMMEQIHKKIESGFRCIKIKIGGLDFDEECKILEEVRARYPSKEITIRLDANGAFKAGEAMDKLQRLSAFEIHSIEQPIREAQTEMEELCRKSPIPIALDEELIRHYTRDGKRRLLERLKPSFIVLKPMLHGGFTGCTEWIELAESQGVGWWITSALESNIGLNAICQYTANYAIKLPQGLGTGAIYRDNIDSPLRVADGTILFDQSKDWGSDAFFS